ncbi:uncharacterized protein LOC142914974 [Petromyzon marinus]|uniref:uncharacterized protein LOC142914974 n=1 Tax=Petromyzon marinus TaxID=7757 RepID=UPI003F72BA7B
MDRETRVAAGRATTSVGSSSSSMAGRGGVQVVKTHGEPVYVNSLPAGHMHAGRGRTASEWETEAPSGGKTRRRCCPTVHATLCLIALLLAGLLALALLAYLPTELYWQDGQLKFHSKIKVVDTPTFEMHKGEIPTETPVWWLTTKKPPKKALLPVARVILKLPDSKNEDHAETALIWACDASESLLRGGLSCASNNTTLRVPMRGMYVAHAQVTMTCKQSGGMIGVLPSARLVTGSDSGGEMALAHLSGCVGKDGYATMQLRRIFELVAGDEVSVMVTQAQRLHSAFKLTYFDLHLLPAHQD